MGTLSRLSAIFVAGFIALAGPVAGQASADPVPTASTCADTVGVLGQQTCDRVAQILDAAEAATTDEIAVVIVRDTGGQSIESWAMDAFNTWGVGKATANNGVLLAVALEDRELRIQLGDGLAQRFTEGQASEIIGATILPSFRTGDYRTGILEGLDAIRTALGHQVPPTDLMASIPIDAGYVAPYVASPPDYSPPDYSPSTSSSSDSEEGSSFPWIWVVLLGALALVSYVVRRVRGESGDYGDSDYGDSDYSDSDSDYDSGSGWSSRRRRSRSSGSRGFSSSSRRSSSSSRRSGFGGGRSSGRGSSGKW